MKTLDPEEYRYAVLSSSYATSETVAHLLNLPYRCWVHIRESHELRGWSHPTTRIIVEASWDWNSPLPLEQRETRRRKIENILMTWEDRNPGTIRRINLSAGDLRDQ